MTDRDPLDALLADWARAPVASGLPDLAAITALPQLPPLAAPVRRLPWLAGGAAAMAAAVAAVFMVPNLAGSPRSATAVVAAAPPISTTATTTTLAEAEDTAAFASVFTPTDIEEDVI